jgi:methionyl aminopeptidase
MRRKKTKDRDLERLLDLIEQRFRTLPFAGRWLRHLEGFSNVDTLLSEMIESRFVMTYPVLVEKSRAPVSQAEHTVLVTKDGFECLTGQN